MSCLTKHSESGASPGYLSRLCLSTVAVLVGGEASLEKESTRKSFLELIHIEDTKYLGIRANKMPQQEKCLWPNLMTRV